MSKSHSILATSNKCEFQNYFSDPIKIAEESEIAMTKAIISIPVRANQYITLPRIDTTDAAYMAQSILVCKIDGIEKYITWTEIHTAYTNLVNNIEDTLPIDEFYSGEYRLPLSNFIVYWNPTTNTNQYRPSINAILSRALNSNYDFYFIRSLPEYSMTDANTINTGETITLNGNPYQIRALRNQSLELGFQALYSPYNYANPDTECTAANDLLWTSVNTMTVVDDINGCNILSTAGAGVDEEYESIAQLTKAVTYKDGGARVDPNGGFFSFKLHSMGAIASTQAVVGFALGMGEGGIEGITKMPIEDIEFGVLFDYDGTFISLQVIDGGYDAVDNTGGAAVGSRFVHLRPLAQFNKVTLGEFFFLRIVRAPNNMPNSRTFNFQVLTGPSADWNTNDKPDLIYNSTFSIGTPLDLVPVFCANRSGVEMKNFSIVPVSVESLQQLMPNYDDDVLGIPLPAEPHGVGAMEIYIDPGYGFDELDDDVVRFWGNLGLYTGTNGAGKSVKSVNGYVYDYHIPRQPAEVAYAFGDTTWGGIFQEDNHWASGSTTIAYRNVNSSLPRSLEVRINDLNVVTSSGSFVGANIYDENVVNRIVGTIPIPAEYLNRIGAFDMNISYEPYNLIYRDLRNLNEVVVNQLNIKVSSKNFETNTEEDIKNINGTLKLEFHVKKV